jgi:hypothetical protein
MTSSVADDLRHRHLLTKKQTHMIRSPEARIQVFEVNRRGWLSPVARYTFQLKKSSQSRVYCDRLEIMPASQNSLSML